MMEGILVAVGGGVILAVVLFNGIMFALKPKEWAANRWSLYDKNLLYLLDSPIHAFGMRVAGAFLAILSTSMFLGVMGRLFESDIALAMSKWLLVPVGLFFNWRGGRWPLFPAYMQ